MGSQFQIIDKKHGRFEGNAQVKHYTAVGQLITAFSSLEISITHYYRDLVDLPYRVAMEMAGDGRSGSLVTMIRRILPLLCDDLNIRMRVESVLTDVSSVKKVRDHLAHRPFAVSGDNMAFFNGFTARNLKGDIAVYSLDDLKECCTFCSRLSAMLGYCGSLSGDPVAFKEIIELRKTEADLLWQALQKKPAALQRTNPQKARPIRPKRERPPPPSQV